MSCILFGKHTKMVAPGHCFFKETTVNLECIIRTAMITLWYSNISSILSTHFREVIKHHSGTHCRTSCPVMKYVLWNLLSWEDFSHALPWWRVIKDDTRREWKKLSKKPSYRKRPLTYRKISLTSGLISDYPQSYIDINVLLYFFLAESCIF